MFTRSQYFHHNIKSRNSIKIHFIYPIRVRDQWHFLVYDFLWFGFTNSKHIYRDCRVTVCENYHTIECTYLKYITAVEFTCTYPISKEILLYILINFYTTCALTFDPPGFIYNIRRRSICNIMNLNFQNKRKSSK